MNPLRCRFFAVHRLDHFRAQLFVIAGLGIVVAMTSAHAEQRLEQGPMVMTYAPRPRGMTLLYDGVQIVKHSDIVATAPTWTPHHYVGPTAEALESAVLATGEKARSLTVTHRGDLGAFVGREQLTLLDSGELEQVFEGQFVPDDGEALLQWRIAALDPALIIGRPFRAVHPDGTTSSGIVPVMPVPEQPPLAKGFSQLEFDSRIGLVRITVDSERPLVFYDYRASRWANPGDPFFWFGDLDARIRRDQPARYRIRYAVVPVSAGSRVLPDQEVAVPVGPAWSVLSPAPDGVPTIIPRPREIQPTGTNAVLATLPVEPPAEAAAGAAHTELIRYWRTLAPAESADQPAAPALTMRRAAADAELPPEGYSVAVDGDGIAITAADTSGFLNAVQTVKQMSWRNRAGAIEVFGARIRDWPALSFRGVHMFTGGQGPQLHAELIRDVLAAAKINHLVLQAEYVKWDAFPEIHHPRYGMSKDEVRGLLALCRALEIEVIPLIQTLGHCQWMFEGGNNLDLAEDPEARWAYCVTNPQAYDFIFTVFREALELFHPRILHIGHDEFTDRGRVPFRPESQPFTVEQLFVMDTRKIHAWLAERGVRTMMWGDMLLAKNEAPDACNAKSPETAAALRAELPDDILIADWHYVDAPAGQFTSLKVFHDAGHQTVASTWYRPGNIVGFAQAAWQNKARGLLQTTWAGYSLDRESFARETFQYIAHVFAADAAWNADRAPQIDLAAAGEAFFRMRGTTALPVGWRDGWTVDLAPAANLSLAAESADGWFGLGPEHDLSRTPTGPVRLGGVRWDIASHGASNAVALAGKLSAAAPAPQAVTLHLDQPAEMLLLLVTTPFPCAAGTIIASAEIRTPAGATERLELVYGRNIFACTDLTSSGDAPIVWRGRTASGQDVGLRAAVWPIEKTTMPISSITFRGSNAPSPLVLVALTGIAGAR